MINLERINQNPGGVDWVRELGPELYNHDFCYFIQDRPEIIQLAATASTYQLLTNRRLVDAQIARGVEELASTKGLGSAGQVASLFERMRAEGGTKIQRDEAVEQGRKAVTSMKRFGLAQIGFDYFQGMPIKSSIRMSRKDNDLVSVHAPLPELLGTKGLPTRIMALDISLKGMTEGKLDYTTALKRIAQGLGEDPDLFLQDLFDYNPAVFGFKLFDRKGGAIPFPIRDRVSLKELYEALPEEQKEKLRMEQPDYDVLHGELYKTLRSRSNPTTTAIFEFSIYHDAVVRYDPSVHHFVGKLNPTKREGMTENFQWIHRDPNFYFGVEPNLAPTTSHTDLLDIRRQAQEIVRDLKTTLQA